MQNGYLERFTGTFRDDCLTIHWVRSVADARRTIEDCRQSSNTARPHSALCGRTPTQQALYYQQANSLA
jgi:putative transposase